MFDGLATRGVLIVASLEIWKKLGTRESQSMRY